MTENLSLSILSRFMGQPVMADTPVGSFNGTLKKADSSQHQGVGNLLLETPSGWLLVKTWIAIKTSTADADATLSRSLRAVEISGKKFLNGKTVANNVVKLSLGDHGENPLSWNVKSLRNVGVMENGEF